MNRDSETPWTQAEGLANVATMNDQDFNDFLDLDSFDNFTPFDPSAQDTQPPGIALQHANGSTRDRWRPAEHGVAFNQPASQYHGDNGEQIIGHYPSEQDMSMSQDSMEQMVISHDAYRPHARTVPPTPNSSQMYPNSLGLSRGLDEYVKQNGGRFSFNPDDPSFTPLVTPENIPNSAYSYVQDYMPTGSYNMSPLTSPALIAQNLRDYQLPNSRTADSSAINSPIDGSFTDRTSENHANGDGPRKARKRNANSAASTPAAKPRQPSKSLSKGRRSSTSLSSAAKSRKAVEPKSGIESSIISPHTAPHSPRGSTNASISPQPLLESAMAPPPKPATPAHTPRARPLPDQVSAKLKPPPATPASLMRMRASKAGGEGADGLSQIDGLNDVSMQNPGDHSMELLTLPEAAAPVPDPEAAAPRVLLPTKLQTNDLSKSKSGASTASPVVAAVKSPTSGSVNGKADGALSRGSKKRGSSTNLISPALRPKISPSIRPMLPAGATTLSRDAHELLLASKSNYQNLLEGNQLPGVNYPAELSTNLTSKRTSHKIAEQGRRNRINTALQEMQSLLPSPIAGTAAKDELLDGKAAVDSKSPESSCEKKAATTNGKTNGESPNNKASNGNAQGGNSKAATVELAIEYIKTLRTQNADKDMEIERLRKELSLMRASLSPGSSA